MVSSRGLGDVYKRQLPEEFPDIFGDPVKKAADDTFSPRGFQSLRSAGGRLRLDNSEGGKKLFAVLQKIHNDPYSLGSVEEAVKTKQIDPLTLTLIAKIALKIAIAVLEVRAPNTESEWDDRLLALLKLFFSQPATINAAHAAVLTLGK